MMTAMSKPDETERLQDLGRASMQIVHDLKNQLNGLKLYATFLRRRIEKGERPSDEQETITKLINGLDRTADDLSTIVRYGQPLELKKQPGFELEKVLRATCSNLNETNSQIVCQVDSGLASGNFDHFRLTDALKWMCVGAIKFRGNEEPGEIRVHAKASATDPNTAMIEFFGLHQLDHDPFRSFAGSDEVRLALAAKIIEAHGGSARFTGTKFVVELPLN